MVQETLLIKSLFFFSVFWGLAILLLWFRPRIEIFWKIIATLIFAFNAWFFFDAIREGFNSFTAGWYAALLIFLKESLLVTFINTFYLWPIVLVVIFYKADDMGAEKLLKFMSVLTLVLWILFVVYFYFHSGIDTFLYEKLKKMIPGG